MSKNKEILFIGGLFVDLVAYATKFPQRGETVCGSEIAKGFGGKAGNASFMAKRLGGQVHFMGKIGSDNFGKEYLEDFKSEGIDVSHISIVEGSNTGMALIFVEESSGENEIIHVPGANHKMTMEDVQKAELLFKTVPLAVFGLETNDEPNLFAMKLAHDNETTIILNAAPARQNLDPRYVQYSDIVCVNRTEAEIFSGKAVNHKEDLEQALKMILDKQLNAFSCTIVALGAEGAMFAEKPDGIVKYVSTTLIEDAVDTTGAGDAFVGALAYFLLHFPKLQKEEIIRRACLVASESIRKPGAHVSYPKKEDLPANLFEP